MLTRYIQQWREQRRRKLLAKAALIAENYIQAKEMDGSMYLAVGGNCILRYTDTAKLCTDISMARDNYTASIVRKIGGEL